MLQSYISFRDLTRFFVLANPTIARVTCMLCKGEISIICLIFIPDCSLIQGRVDCFLRRSLYTINCNTMLRAKQTIFPASIDEWGKSVPCCLCYFLTISSSIRNWRRTILWIGLHSRAEGKIDPILRARQFYTSRQQVKHASRNIGASVATLF